MREAVIVSTARTAIGRAYRGAFNDTEGQSPGGSRDLPCRARAGMDVAEVDDVVLGVALQQGNTGTNVARQAAVRAGLPVSVPGMTVDRQCASGLMAISTAAKQIVATASRSPIGGGLESISLVQNDQMNMDRAFDPWLGRTIRTSIFPCLHTAEIVAERYGISREAQDEYALASQQRTAQAQKRGLFDDEIVPFTSSMMVQDKEPARWFFRGHAGQG